MPQVGAAVVIGAELSVLAMNHEDPLREISALQTQRPAGFGKFRCQRRIDDDDAAAVGPTLRV